ncbi:hypothetical protein RRG08_013006 [Elysia crispata]|uniref:Uncharacterized protein n=1 Tax=Elysia crispata TaxID=231223 RepID=A0AAE1A094_9GAST|nr:hypothetical protein RRG08_013006 [Elysia crispata]
MKASSTGKSLLLICIFCFLSPHVDGQYGKEVYENLTATIFNGYDKRIRPTLYGGPTYVDMVFEPLSIIGLDENSQVLSTFGRMYYQWSDEVLAWNSSDYSGITNFLWPQDDVWLPDIIIANSVEEEKRQGYKEMPVRIRHTGKILWVPSSIFQTSCDMDVTFYPFDTQICSIVISAKMSTYHDIEVRSHFTSQLGTGQTGVTWVSYSPGGSWDLQSITIEDLSAVGGVTRFQFKLKLKRLRTYYVVNIIIPVIFLSLTASLVFYLPADAGEKIEMSMTVLLAYAVYLTIIADNMPQTSMQVSLLAVYLTILLAVTAMGVVLSVVVLNLHHTSDETPIGARTEAFARYVRRYLRLGQHPKKLSNKVRPVLNTPATTLTDADFLSTKNGHMNHMAPPMDARSPSKLGRNKEHGSFVSNSSKTTNDGEEREIMTWPKVAEAIDRLLFLAFTCLVFFVTIILLPYMAIMS